MRDIAGYSLATLYNAFVLYGTFLLVTEYNWSEWTFLASAFFIMSYKSKQAEENETLLDG